MKNIISVIGAGGKTSLLHKMSDYYLGKKETVLLTTTTHMMLEKDTDISCDIFSIIERLKNDKYCMAGKICDGSNKKIQALPLEILKGIMPYADNILIEADGAKHYSLKYPLESEPVIFEFTTDVYLVLGLWDIGKYCKDVIFRFEDMSFELGTKADEKVTFEHIKQIQKGYEKRLRKLGFKGKMHYIYSKKTDDGIVFLKE